ncbi:MAG: UvrD-helicase domain-containing protein, partial [Candidatus Hydrogenedentes bacterium]|nr:UvrD-helicase domain-containing protein [Candidatus Hydrogenedentota bacterium]
ALSAGNAEIREDALRAITQLNARGGSKGKWKSEDAFGRVGDILKCLRESIKSTSLERPAEEQELKAAERTCDLMHVYGHVREALDRAKEQRNACDFEDLIVQTAQMLRGDARGQDAVRARVARSIKHLMIDECQDTDSLQLEIARLLARADQGPRLFIVGDAKQSIYYFRGAEVEVFHAARAEAGEVVRMDKNFRTLPDVLHFINEFFVRSNLLREAEPTYAPMKVHRDPVQDSRVEFLIPPILDESSTADYRDAEADLLARRIAALCGEGAPATVYDPKLQTFRRAQFGDVAILLRAFSDVHRYERALREASIPFAVVAGVGFYQRQEVLDLLNLLTVLVDPWNELALLGWLRSPIVGLSDPALVRLCGGVEHPLGLAAQFHGEGTCGDPEQDNRLDAARTLLEDLRAHAGMPLAEFIHYVIDQTRYEAILLGQFLGVQRASNIRKLAELAGAFGPGTSPRLGAFVRYLSEASTTAIREGEAAVDTEGRCAVSIMTVHKSKGLEFPIVAVADMGRAVQPGSNAPMAFHRALGLAVKVTGDSGDKESPGCLNAINARQKREELAEQARVLYVAMTRARDYLILSGPPDSEKGNSWFAAMHTTFGILDRADGDTIRGDGWIAKVRRSEQASPREDVTPPGEPLPAPDVLKSRVGPPPPETWTPEVFAITRVLEAFKKDGAQDEPERDEDVPRDRGTALRRGTLVHRFLELWDFVTKPGRLIEELVLAECPLREDRTRLVADLRRVASILSSHEWGARLASPTGIRREVPFLLRLNGSLVRGTIDALLEDGSIIDYKTGRRSPEKDEVYRRQIQLYASAIHSLTGALPPAGYLLYVDGDHGLEIDSVDVSSQAVERTRAEAIIAMRASSETAAGRAP